MDVVVKRCAGLDVHRDNVVATVRVPSEDQGRYDRRLLPAVDIVPSTEEEPPGSS